MDAEVRQGGSGSPLEGVWIAPDPSGTVKEPSPPEAEKSELHAEAERFVEWFVALLARTSAPEPRMTPTVRAGWADAYEKLRRIDRKEKAEIVKVCEWARGDPFWSGNFYAPTKLRERKDGISRYDLFLSKLKSPNGNARTQRPNPRDCESTRIAIADYEAYDKRVAAGGV